MPQDTPGLPFEIDDAMDPTLGTGRARVPLGIEVFRHIEESPLRSTPRWA
jgi:hypothetical protein